MRLFHAVRFLVPVSTYEKVYLLLILTVTSTFDFSCMATIEDGKMYDQIHYTNLYVVYSHSSQKDTPFL